MSIRYFFNSFLVNIPILQPLKTQEKLRFSALFRGYKMEVAARNGFTVGTYFAINQNPKAI